MDIDSIGYSAYVVDERMSIGAKHSLYHWFLSSALILMQPAIIIGFVFMVIYWHKSLQNKMNKKDSSSNVKYYFWASVALSVLVNLAVYIRDVCILIMQITEYNRHHNVGKLYLIVTMLVVLILILAIVLVIIGAIVCKIQKYVGIKQEITSVVEQVVEQAITSMAQQEQDLEHVKRAVIQAINKQVVKQVAINKAKQNVEEAIINMEEEAMNQAITDEKVKCNMGQIIKTSRVHQAMNRIHQTIKQVITTMVAQVMKEAIKDEVKQAVKRAIISMAEPVMNMVEEQGIENMVEGDVEQTITHRAQQAINQLQAIEHMVEQAVEQVVEHANTSIAGEAMEQAIMKMVEQLVKQAITKLIKQAIGTRTASAAEHGQGEFEEDIHVRSTVKRAFISMEETIMRQAITSAAENHDILTKYKFQVSHLKKKEIIAFCSLLISLQLLSYHMYYIVLAVITTPMHSVPFVVLYITGLLFIMVNLALIGKVWDRNKFGCNFIFIVIGCLCAIAVDILIAICIGNLALYSNTHQEGIFKTVTSGYIAAIIYGILTWTMNSFIAKL